MSSILSSVDGLDDDFLEGVFEEFGEEGVEAFQKLSKESKSFGDAFSKIGTKLKDTGIGIWSFITQNWIALAAAATVATVAIIAYNNSFSKLCENAKESKAALEETTSELESMRGQKQTNQDRIAELKKSGSSANEDEITSLERQNALLQAQIALKEKLEEDQRVAAAKDAYKALSKKFYVSTGDAYAAGAGIATATGASYYAAAGEVVTIPVTESKDIVDLTADDISRYDELQQKYNDVTDALADYNKKKEDGVTLSKDEEKDFENLTKQAESYQAQMDNLDGRIDKNKDTILELYQSITNPDGSVITGYETMANKILAIFPELQNNSFGLSENMRTISDTYRKAIADAADSTNLAEEFDSWLSGLNETDQDIVYELSLKTDTAYYSLQDWKEALADTKAQVEGLSDIPIDIEVETTGLETVTSAINESASATGLAATSISELKSRYSDLDGFDVSALFKNTSTGVKLNTRELARLEKQYESLNKQKLSDSLEQLYEDYDKLTKQIEEYSDKSETALEDLEAQRKATLDDIDYVKQLAAEYDGLTSAYAEWVNAQSATQSGAWYDSAKEGLDSLKELYKSGDYGNTALQEGLEYFTNADITSIDNWYDRMQAIDSAYKQLDTTIAGTTYSINDFMAGGQDGCNNYLEAIQQLGKGWATFDAATNSWELDYNKFDLAAQLGTSVEFIEMMQDKLEQYGFQFENGQIIESAQTFEGQLLELREVINSLDSESADISVELNTPEKQLNRVKKLISETTDEVALESLYGMVDELVNKVNQPAFMEIDVSQVDESLQEPLNLLKEYQYAVNNVEALKIKGADTSEIDAASIKVSELANQLASLDANTLSNLGFNLDGVDFDNLASELEAQIPTLEIPIIASTTSNGESTAEELTVAVNYELGEQAPPNDMSAIVNYELGDVAKPDDVTVKVNYKLGTVDKPTTDGGQGLASGTVASIGTAYASGTAMTRGKISGAPGGRTLMGELGEELYVDPSTNRWQTVGTNGAEFVNLPHNAIVFNHRQTASLLSQSHIVGRGKAMASGNVAAMLYRKDLDDAIGSGGNIDSSGGGSLSGSKNKYSGGSGSGSSNSSASNDDKEKFDWIKILIDRTERIIDKLARITESAYKKLATKLGASYDQIAKVTEEIAIQEKAYDSYIKEANSVGLSSDLEKLVQNGKIDISKYDSDTQEKIKEYQEWYEKALACQDAVGELHETLAELYEDNFNNIQEDFDNQIELLEHLTKSYENQLDALEAKGYLESTEYYAALQDVEKKNLEVLNKELAALEKSFSEAMASGEIEEGSDAWYEMQIAINETKEAIDEANLALLEYEKTMRELEWEHFDYQQERISKLTDESDFMIDLMDNSDLHDESGKLTDDGMAVVGLHGQNYNVYMAQADRYAEEIKKLDEEIAKDPNNTDLIERREELLELQRESILAAEDEKQAIADLVEEGINRELEALREVIDTYKDALDSAKDLYDYRKKIADQTKKIAAIEKQLSAYENDLSEETKATVQKLKVELEEAKSDLEETEYEKYISDQKKLLDELYDQYETVLNQRLDNVDALVEEMIGTVNANTASINTTLTETANSVGYTMTDSMQSIWDGSTDALEGTISTYGDGFNEKLTAINAVLNEIETSVEGMVNASDAEVTNPNNSDTKYQKYASGGLVDYTGPAWVDGTPNKPEMVLNHRDTANFIELKEFLRELASRELDFADRSPFRFTEVPQFSDTIDFSSVLSSIMSFDHSDLANTYGDFNITIPIEHIEDYNDFVNQLKNDKKFERMIQDITVNRLSGGSQLAKNRHRWG